MHEIWLLQLAANSVQRVLRDQWQKIVFLHALGIFEFPNHSSSFLVENVNEFAHDVPVESRSKNFPSLVPFTSCKRSIN